jgi:hypothetical protein
MKCQVYTDIGSGSHKKKVILTRIWGQLLGLQLDPIIPVLKAPGTWNEALETVMR